VRPALLTLVLVFLVACGAVVCAGLVDHVGRSDVAVVLGTKVERDGEPSLALQARLGEALTLYRRGLFPLVMVSGAHGREGFDEGTVMKRWLVARGVPEAAVIADNEGVNTWATAKNAAALMRARRLRSAMIVSQYYHTPRSRLAFEKNGITALCWAHARYWSWRDLYAVPREVAGWVEYLLK
jgi:vancomycin permeability regulator SanA